jgi:hypothetical protein
MRVSSECVRPGVAISTTAPLPDVVEDGSQESGSDRHAGTGSWVRSGRASDDLGSRCICTVRWSSLCRRPYDPPGFGKYYFGWSSFDQSRACGPSPVRSRVLFRSLSFVRLSFVYDLRSFLGVLMLMDGDLLSILLLMLVLLKFLLLLSEVGLVR